MIDHAAARISLATSLDFSLEVSESDALEEHLHQCPACRSVGVSMRNDATVLRELDFGPVPAAIRAKVAIAAERRGRGGAGRWVGLVAVGALLLVALGSGVLGTGSSPNGTTVAGNPIHWATDVVDLKAADFWIEANGQRFRAAAVPASVYSDPGNPTSRTFEVEWTEHGVPMWFYLYLGGDDTSWWVREIRTRDGHLNADWAALRGVWFKSPLGAAWTGDLDVTLTDVAAAGSTPTRVHLAGATLTTQPQASYVAPAGGGKILPADVDPTGPGGAVYCDPVLRLDPVRAQEALLKRDFRVAWRFMSADGSGPTGWAGPLQPPPSGVIQGAAVGSSGELVIFVADAGQGPPKMLPGDCPSDAPPAAPSVPPSPAPSPAPSVAP